MKKSSVVLGMILAMSVVLGFPCYGQENPMIYACYHKHQGQLRIVSGPNSCRPSEIPISWYTAGPNIPMPNSVTVDCSSGQTISQALEQIPGSPLTITVKGTCNENVAITRDDVTLIADPSGGGVNGPESNKSTINISASRTVINGLVISGGIHGILVNGSATIQNSTIQNAAHGIAFYHGGRGLVDNCTITNNERNGILIEAASATITNNTISSNPGTGITVRSGGGARIGIPDHYLGATGYAGNAILNNGTNGINVSHSANAVIGGNTISGNGTNPILPGNQFGIIVVHAHADLTGGNTISGNLGSGILVSSATVFIGDASWGLPANNTITGNGFGSTNPGGIHAIMDSSLDIRNATITGNYIWGIRLTISSHARMRQDTPEPEVDKILVWDGSGINLQKLVNPVKVGDLICSPSSHYTPDSDLSGVGFNQCTSF